MADNVVANSGDGLGPTFATDQRSSDSVHFPLGKMVWGALDTFTLVDSGASAVPIQDGGNSITVDAASLPLPTGAATAAKQPALGTAGSASADVITVQGIASMTALKVDGSAVTQPVSGTVTSNAAAATTGGATPGKLISAASTNATSIKGSAGTLYSVTVTSVNAAVRYLKFYDKATAPTVGTDTPVAVYGIPGNTAGAGHAVPLPACGLAFSNGIGMALTTGIADSDTGAVSANEHAVSYSYK